MVKHRIWSRNEGVSVDWNSFYASYLALWVLQFYNHISQKFLIFFKLLEYCLLIFQVSNWWWLLHMLYSSVISFACFCILDYAVEFYISKRISKCCFLTLSPPAVNFEDHWWPLQTIWIQMKPHEMWGFIWDPNYLTFRNYLWHSGIKNWLETKFFCKFWRKKY